MTEWQIKYLKNYSWKRNLIIFWKVGVGKTYEVSKVYNNLLRKYNKNIPYTVSYFINDASFRQKMLSWDLVLKKEELWQQTIEKYPLEKMLKTHLLFFDDLWVSNNTEAYLEKLYFVIDSRVEKNKKFVITTNLTLDELKEKLWERLTSRLLFNTDIITIKWEDKRMQTTKIIE